MPQEFHHPNKLRKEHIKNVAKEIVAVEPPIDSVKIAISTFFGGLVAYLVWILLHKLFSMVGLSEAATFVVVKAQELGAGDAVAAGAATGTGGYVASEVYKRIKEPLGIHSDPPPPPEP